MSVYGISLGASVSVLTDSTGEIYRNELGGHTTASLVSFTAEGRALGEAAVSGLTANAKSTAAQVGRLAVLPYDTLSTGDGQRISRYWQFSHEAGADGKLQMVDVAVAGESEPQTVGAIALAGALLGKMRATSGAPEGAPLALAMPMEQTPEVLAALADAAAVGGWKLVAAPSAAAALGTTLARKWPFAKTDAGGPPRTVLVLDMGATSSVAALLSLTPPAEAGGEASHAVLAEAADPFLGCALFDAALFDHFAAQIEAKYSEAVAPASRRGLRLITAVERLRKLLSTLPEVSLPHPPLPPASPTRLSRDCAELHA